MDFRQIQFCTGLEAIELLQLQELLTLAAFGSKERRLEELERALWKSAPVVSVWEGTKMIGFARAISDGIYRAMIWDVIIHPQYQGVGLEQKLLETILSHPRMNRVERVYLMNTNPQHLYQQMGFQWNSSTTMVLLNQSLATSRSSLTAELS